MAAVVQAHLDGVLPDNAGNRSCPNDQRVGESSRHARLPADDLKLHVDIAARRVGIGADLFVCFLG
jgi:hypothetical protein